MSIPHLNVSLVSSHLISCFICVLHLCCTLTASLPHNCLGNPTHSQYNYAAHAKTRHEFRNQPCFATLRLLAVNPCVVFPPSVSSCCSDRLLTHHSYILISPRTHSRATVLTGRELFKWWLSLRLYKIQNYHVHKLLLTFKLWPYPDFKTGMAKIYSNCTRDVIKEILLGVSAFWRY